MSITFYLCLLIAYLEYGNDMVYGFPHSRLPFGFNVFSPGYMGFRPQQNVTDDIAFVVGWPETESTASLGEKAHDEREDNQQISLDKSFIDFFDGQTDVALLSETSSSTDMGTNVDLLKDLRKVLSGEQNLNAPVENANLSVVAGNEKFASPSYRKTNLRRNEVVPHESLGPSVRLRHPYGVNKHRSAHRYINRNYVSPFYVAPGNGGEELTIMEYEPSQPKLLGGTYLYPALTKSPAIMINWLNETPLIKSVGVGFQGADRLLSPYQFSISIPYQLKYQKVEESGTTSSSLHPSSSQSSTVDITVSTSHTLPSARQPVLNTTFIPFYAAPQFWGSYNNHTFKPEDSPGMGDLPKLLGFPFTILPIQFETAAATELSSATASFLKTTATTVSNTPDTTLRSQFVLNPNEVRVPNNMELRTNMQCINLSNPDAAVKFGNVMVNGYNADQAFFHRSPPPSVALVLQPREGNTSILIQVLQPPLPMATTHRTDTGISKSGNASCLPSHYSLQPVSPLQKLKGTTTNETGTFDVAKLGLTTIVANAVHVTFPTMKPMSLVTECRSTFPTSKCTPTTSTCTTKRHKTKLIHRTAKKCTTTTSCTTPTTKISTTTRFTTIPTRCSTTQTTPTAWSTRATMDTHSTTMLSGSDVGGRMHSMMAAANKTTVSNTIGTIGVNAPRMQSSMRDVLNRIICGNMVPTMKVTGVTTSHADHVAPTSLTQIPVHFETLTKTSETVDPYTLKIKVIGDSHPLPSEPSSDVNRYYEKLVLDMIHQLESTADNGMNFMNNSALLIIPEDRQNVLSSPNPSLSSDQPIRNCIFPRPTTSPYMPYLEEDENWNYITF